MVDDERKISAMTADFLESKGYSVQLFHDGQTALNALKTAAFDLCILDVKMPKMHGFALAEKISEYNLDLPFIFLTGQSLKASRIEGLKAGAEDYILKPYSLEELYLRIEVIFRRGRGQREVNKDREIRFAGFGFDPISRKLWTGTEEFRLTVIEAKLLKLLYESKNDKLPREETLLAIWNDDDLYKGRILNVYISRLRKFFRSSDKIEILNLHGEGYSLVIQD